MKNMYIETLRNQMKELAEEARKNIKAGADKEQAMKAFNELNATLTDGAHCVLRAYDFSQQANLDELVFNSDSLILDERIDEVIEFCKQAKIRWFVYASGYSSTFETILHFQEHGLKVGKFVVKEYEGTGIYEGEMQKLAGIRINLA